MKYNDELVKEIATLIEEDNFSITDICRMVGIGRVIFYRWKDEKPEFARAIADAESRRGERLRFEARQALRRKLQGTKTVEKRIKYVPDPETGELVIKECVVREKYTEPDTSTVAMAAGSEVAAKPRGKLHAISTPPRLNIVVSDEKIKEDFDKLKCRLHDVPYAGNAPAESGGDAHTAGEINDVA